jgi:GH18 family chitinase
MSSARFLCEPLEQRCLLSGRVVGYFPEYRWSFFSKIDWDAVTHVNYFAISANTDGSLSTGGVNLSHLDTAVATAHANGDKLSIVVGPQGFGTMAANATSLNNFVNNIVAFCNAHDLDGVDIDWEPQPTGVNLTRFQSLIDAMYAQMNPQDLLITAAVYPLNPGVPLAAVQKMDWLNIMAYNFSYADHTTYAASINSLNAWSNWGVPNDKLVLGIPFYGREGTSWQQTSSRIYDAIIDDYFTANGSYPNPDLNFLNGWYYNGPTSVREKTEYVRDNGYGGVMIWELGQDHLNAQGNFSSMSLLPVIQSALANDLVPPAVNDSSFLVGTAPHRITIQFSENVSASLDTTDLVVRNTATQSTLIVTSVTWDSGTSTATFSLNNPAPDGTYTATLSGATVSDPAGNPLGGEYVHPFTFLNGDANLDGQVNSDDFNILASNFGQPGNFFDGDFSYNGVVNSDDFNILASRFGMSAASTTFAATTRIGAPGKPGRILDTLRTDVLA